MSSPLFEQLLGHVHRQRNGEFIAAGESVEVHVYLQRGRIAWATDAANPFAFARYLCSEAKVDDEAFREVLESCRRDRLPLGETLIAWGLATLDVVRSGLRRQVILALATLRACPADASAVFLDRHRFGQYDERLTFAIGELAESELHGAVPASSAQVGVDELLAGVRGASWARVLEGGRVVESAALSGGPNLDELDALRAVTLEAEADFVALRAPDGAILGACLGSPSRQLWCGLSADATYGAAYAAVNALSNAAGRRGRPGDGRSARSRWTEGEEATTWRPSLEQVFQYGADVLAAGLFDVGGALVAGIGAVELAAEQFVAMVARRRVVFGLASASTGHGALEALGFRYRTLVVGEPELWCFGSESVGQRPTAWVVTRRGTSQGVGWACLNALGRLTQGGAP